MHRLRIVQVALVPVTLIGASQLAGLNADAAGDPQRGDAARMMRDLMSGTAAVGGPFTLTDVDGRRRSLADFRGKVVITLRHSIRGLLPYAGAKRRSAASRQATSYKLQAVFPQGPSSEIEHVFHRARLIDIPA
jgi:hypothetical protein